MNFLRNKDNKDVELRIANYYRTGLTLFENGRLEEAILQFQRVLSLNPNHTFAHYHIGEINQQKGYLEEALAHFKEALKTNKGDIEPVKIHIALATTFFNLSQLKQALQEFKTAIELAPQNLDLHLDIGEVYYQLGEYDEAIAHFERTGQSDSWGQRYLAKALWHKGEREKSISILKETTKIFPSDAEVYAYLGYLLLEMEEYQEAIAVLKRAIELDKEDSEETFANLGEAYYQAGHLDEALEVYQRAMKLFPNNLFDYRRVGFIYQKQGKLNAALQIWQRMVEIDDTAPESHRTLALGFRESGNFEAALEEMNQAIALDPTYAPNYGLKGTILLDMGREGDAIVAFEQAIKLGDDITLLDLAEAHRDLGNTEKAIHFAKTYIEAAQKTQELKTYLKDATAILNDLQSNCSL